MEPGETRYIAKFNTWFDEGTEVLVISDYRHPSNPLCNIALFFGLHKGVISKRVCNFDDFEIIV